MRLRRISRVPSEYVCSTQVTSRQYRRRGVGCKSLYQRRARTTKCWDMQDWAHRRAVWEYVKSEGPGAASAQHSQAVMAVTPQQLQRPQKEMPSGLGLRESPPPSSAQQQPNIRYSDEYFNDQARSKKQAYMVFMGCRQGYYSQDSTYNRKMMTEFV
jgi:hypothetical protein